MTPPEDSSEPRQKKKVCHILKNMYLNVPLSTASHSPHFQMEFEDMLWLISKNSVFILFYFPPKIPNIIETDWRTKKQNQKTTTKKTLCSSQHYDYILLHFQLPTCSYFTHTITE